MRWCQIDESAVSDLARDNSPKTLYDDLVSQHVYCNGPLPYARLTVQSAGFILALHSGPPSFAGLTIREERHLGPNAMCRLFPHEILQILPCVAFRQLA